MFIGAYLCAGSFTFVLGLVILAARFNGDATVRSFRERILSYAGLALAISGLGLVAFVGLSYLAGFMRFGEAVSWSYPNDYLAGGPVGWALMIIPLLGIIAPLALLLWFRWPARTGNRGA